MSFGEDVCLTTAGVDPPSHGYQRFEGELAASRLDGWLGSDLDGLGSSVAFEVYRSLHPDFGREEERRPVRAALREALRHGWLRAYRRPMRLPTLGAGEPRAEEATTAPASPKTKETSWIEIALVDMEDNPVAGERYRLTLPDGTVAEGSLDAQGQASVDCETPGTCQLTFPDLDQEAWVEA